MTLPDRDPTRKTRATKSKNHLLKSNHIHLFPIHSVIWPRPQQWSLPPRTKTHVEQWSLPNEQTPFSHDLYFTNKDPCHSNDRYPTNRPLSNDDLYPTNRPLSNDDLYPTNRALSNDDLYPTNKDPCHGDHRLTATSTSGPPPYPPSGATLIWR